MGKKTIVFLFVILCNFQLQIKAQIDTEQAMKTGRNALCREDYATALHYFDQVIKAKPYLPEPYYYRAVTRYYLNDIQGSDEDCSACIQRDPFITNAYQLRGEIRQKSENFDGAKADYEHALKEMPNNKYLLINLGIVHIRRKSYEEAKTYLNKVIRLYPKYNGGYTAMASLYFAMNDTAQAQTYYNKSVETGKYDSQSYSTRALFYLQAQKYDDAEADLNEAIRINPDVASNYINRGLSRYYRNDLRGAMTDYNKALDINPEDQSALFNRALLRAHVGDNNRAIEDFDAILKNDPKNYAAYYQRAVLKNAVSDTQGALKDLSELMTKYPDYSGALSLYEKMKGQIKSKPKATAAKEYIYIHNIEEINRHRPSTLKKGQTSPSYETESTRQNTFENVDQFSAPLVAEKEENEDGIEAKSELKEYLWKTIRPSKSIYIPNSSIIKVTEHKAKNYDANYYYGLMKAGITLDKLKIFSKFDRDFERTHPQNYNTYKYNLGDMIQRAMPHNDFLIQFMGGSLGTSVSGANLSGGGKKQLSNKTKKVLKEVYGRDVDAEKEK